MKLKPNINILPSNITLIISERTNVWLLETAGVTKSLLASVKERKLAYNGQILRKKGV